MVEEKVLVPTQHGDMPSFVVHPDGAGPWPAIILYMDALGIREEMRNLARRIAKAGYVCILPDMYYRLGTLRFDVKRRTEALSKVIRGAIDSLTNAMVAEDTNGLIAFLDAHPKVKPGPMGCIGYCMSGRYITTVAGRFPHRIKAAASLYGVGIITDKEDSPHLLLDRVQGELYFAFAEHDAYVPDGLVAQLRGLMQQHGLRGAVEDFPGTHHGFGFPERGVYDSAAAEHCWQRIFAMWQRTLHQGISQQGSEA